MERPTSKQDTLRLTYLLNFRVPAEFEIGIEIGSVNVRLTPIFDSNFDPDTEMEPKLS